MKKHILGTTALTGLILSPMMLLIPIINFIGLVLTFTLITLLIEHGEL